MFKSKKEPKNFLVEVKKNFKSTNKIIEKSKTFALLNLITYLTKNIIMFDTFI